VALGTGQGKSTHLLRCICWRGRSLEELLQAKKDDKDFE